MPNYVTTSLTVIGPREDLKKFIDKAKHKGEKGEEPLSFNSFVPMPESLNVTEGSDGDFGYALYIEESPDLLQSHWAKNNNIHTLEALQLWADIHRPEARKLGEAYKYNLEHHGHRSWYGWSVANWGTKWDACSLSCTEMDTVEGDTCSVSYHFDTAWSPCEPVIEAMSQQFPTLTFTAVFDEESHSFYYEAVWEQGEKISEENLEREPDEESDDDEDNFDEAEPDASSALQALLQPDEGACARDSKEAP